MKVDHHICLHCGSCVGACPENAIVLVAASSIRFLPTCTTCGLCAKVCPVGAVCNALPERDADIPTCVQREGRI